jgi:spermidine synthase
LSSIKRGKNIPNAYIIEDSMSNLWDVWYRELHRGQSGITVKVKRILESTQSKYQRIDVLDTEDFGRILVLYGSIMIADKDLNSYNEMITHVPLFTHPSPENVLIIGGGDCGALTNAVMHPEVRKVTMCELDRKVVEVARRHFPAHTKGLESKKARVVYMNGKDFVDRTKEKYDVILLDLSDPIGPAADLFQKKFQAKVYRRLKSDGILVAQSESPYFNQITVRRMYHNLRRIFPIVKMYTAHVPIYPSCFWSFAFCSRKYDPTGNFDMDRWRKLKLKTTYYNSDIHMASFSLPEYVKELLEGSSSHRLKSQDSALPD